MNRLHLVATVRCLACSTVYSKAASVGTAESNPGCPKCGYVGWIPADQDEDDQIIEARARIHFDEDRPRLRFWRAS